MGSANQKHAKAQIQAEAAMAGSMATSRWQRMTTVKPAIDRLITTASNLPKRLPPSSDPQSMMPTPHSATALATSVERVGRSPMAR